MFSRLRVPAARGPAKHGDTPVAARTSCAAGLRREFSPGRRDLGVSVPNTRYGTAPVPGPTITGRADAFYRLNYHFIAGFPNRRKDATMVIMTARAP